MACYYIIGSITVWMELSGKSYYIIGRLLHYYLQKQGLPNNVITSNSVLMYYIIGTNILTLLFKTFYNITGFIFDGLKCQQLLHYLKWLHYQECITLLCSTNHSVLASFEAACYIFLRPTWPCSLALVHIGITCLFLATWTHPCLTTSKRNSQIWILPFQ